MVPGCTLRLRPEGVNLSARDRAGRRGTLNDMAKVTIYTTSFCPYCHMAKELLRSKSVIFEEVDVTGQAVLRAEMRDKAGGRNTVPQIWIGERHVGGCDDLMCLDRSGKLDPLLSTSQ
jgi:glutaredoxin 3